MLQAPASPVLTLLAESGAAILAIQGGGPGGGAPVLSAVRVEASAGIIFITLLIKFKAHRLVYHSTLGLRVIKKKKIQAVMK